MATGKGLYNAGSSIVLLALSKAWIGIGLVLPATTKPRFTNIETGATLWRKQGGVFGSKDSKTPTLDRFDSTELFSVQVDQYYMPLSQTFSLRAKKNLQTSNLVDGIEIIEQTRKEAKTIDCTMRITLREDQERLKIVRAGNIVAELDEFLNEIYEEDKVVRINNQYINSTCLVDYVMMTDYKFVPSPGRKSFQFDFTLREIIYGDNVLTFDSRQLNNDVTNRQIQT